MRVAQKLAVEIIIPLAFAGAHSISLAAEPTAEEIMKKSYSAPLVASSTFQATIKLISKDGDERVRKTKGATKLITGTIDNRRITKFLSPADIEGTKSLLIQHSGKDDDMWIYLPAMKKVRRLVSNNKRDSFVGTDMNYGDILQHKVEEWKHKLVKSDKIDSHDCFVIESVPVSKDIAESSGYSKRVNWVDKESYMPLKTESYDVGGQLEKRFIYKDLKKVDAKKDKWQAMRLEGENVQTNHKTLVLYENFRPNATVSDDEFTARSLEKQ